MAFPAYESPVAIGQFSLSSKSAYLSGFSLRNNNLISQAILPDRIHPPFSKDNPRPA